MNRYFTKRKAKKAPALQPKFELDLTTALPAQDDFRTSLIMNSLSARFSMLREQDDPSSLMGKASDDSVLAPRRQSRLMDFGYSPGRTLHDIAEVPSIRSSIRPPFAASNRADSYISEGGYGTDDDSHNGSMMNRSRPGEGNSLFGGRQKIYKIPMAGASSEASIASGTSMRGRILYDEDVSTSTFQRWRQEERERLGAGTAKNHFQADEDSSPRNGQHSPSLGGTVTRHASTSTNAASIGRTSTAATSITSQNGAMNTANSLSSSSATSPPMASGSPALDRNLSKSRRLYDQILTREIEEQQSSALTRLNSLQKGKISTPPSTSGRTNSRQGHPAYQSQTSSQTSPQQSNPFGLPSFPLAEAPIPENDVSQSPSPPRQSNHNPLLSALSHQDRGKATAMGAFNKPQQFSEQQYLERQLTLRGASKGRPGELDEQLKQDRAPSTDIDRSVSPSVYAASTYSTRSRANTNTSASEVNSSAFSVFQSAASQMKASKPASEERQSGESASHGFDFGLAASETDSTTPFGGVSSFMLPPLNMSSTSLSSQSIHSEHPAFKDNAFPRLQSTKSFDAPLDDEQRSSSGASAVYTSSKTDEPVQSLQSLAPANGGLSGLVRQHLRQHSAASSYCDSEERPPVPRFPGQLALSTKDVNTNNDKHHDLVTPADSNYSHASNPFDLEEFKHAVNYGSGQYSPIATSFDDSEEQKSRISVSPKEVRATRRRGMSQAPDTINDVPWTQQLQKNHNRGPSAETIQEQDAFASELARRKAAIQERLRVKMDSESASASPVAEEKTVSGPFRGFDLLRNKSSRESMKKPTDSMVSNKQSKLFGLPSASERPSFQSDRFRSEESISTYTPSLRSRSTSRPATSRSVAPLSKAHPMPSGGDSSRTSDDYPRDRKGSNPPSFSAQLTNSRSRSNSIQSNGRSRSRNGRYKDDLERAMVEGTGSRATTQIWPDGAAIPEDYAPMPSLEKLENTQRFTTDATTSGTSLKISTSRPSMPATGYFESKGLYPPPVLSMNSPLSASSANSSPISPSHGHSSISTTGPSPRPSPGYAQMSPMSARPSPGGFHNIATPPMSGSSTPVNLSFNHYNHPPPPRAGDRSRSLSKKRSIQKHEIGEPRLISTTSVIDTVSLPAGASLRNGMNDIQKSAPPLPAVNPMRQRFGFNQTPRQPVMNGPYSNHEGSTFKPHHRLRKSSSEGAKLGMRLRAQSQATASNPTLIGPGTVRPPIETEGGMF